MLTLFTFTLCIFAGLPSVYPASQEQINSLGGLVIASLILAWLAQLTASGYRAVLNGRYDHWPETVAKSIAPRLYVRQQQAKEERAARRRTLLAQLTEEERAVREAVIARALIAISAAMALPFVILSFWMVVGASHWFWYACCGLAWAAAFHFVAAAEAFKAELAAKYQTSLQFWAQL